MQVVAMAGLVARGEAEERFPLDSFATPQTRRRAPGSSTVGSGSGSRATLPLLSHCCSGKKPAMSTNLANKWVLITGASSGFGAAAARAFASEGCRLLLGARRVDRLEAIAAETKKAGSPAAHVRALDVAQTKSVNDFAAWARTHTDRIDVLVNNAGGAKGLD